MIDSINSFHALHQTSGTDRSLSPVSQRQSSSSIKAAGTGENMDRYSPVGVVESSDNVFITYGQTGLVDTSGQSVLHGERYHPVGEAEDTSSLPADIYKPVGVVGEVIAPVSDETGHQAEQCGDGGPRSAQPGENVEDGIRASAHGAVPSHDDQAVGKQLPLFGGKRGAEGLTVERCEAEGLAIPIPREYEAHGPVT